MQILSTLVLIGAVAALPGPRYGVPEHLDDATYMPASDEAADSFDKDSLVNQMAKRNAMPGFGFGSSGKVGANAGIGGDVNADASANLGGLGGEIDKLLGDVESAAHSAEDSFKDGSKNPWSHHDNPPGLSGGGDIGNPHEGGQHGNPHEGGQLGNPHHGSPHWPGFGDHPPPKSSSPSTSHTHSAAPSKSEPCTTTTSSMEISSSTRASSSSYYKPVKSSSAYSSTVASTTLTTTKKSSSSYLKVVTPLTSSSFYPLPSTVVTSSSSVYTPTYSPKASSSSA